MFYFTWDRSFTAEPSRYTWLLTYLRPVFRSVLIFITVSNSIISMTCEIYRLVTSRCWRHLRRVPAAAAEASVWRHGVGPRWRHRRGGVVGRRSRSPCARQTGETAPVETAGDSCHTSAGLRSSPLGHLYKHTHKHSPTQCPGKKSREYFRHNFIKYWPIFEILSICYNLEEICNKAIVKYPTTPQTRHYTNLWNIDVRKLACPERCGSLTER